MGKMRLVYKMIIAVVIIAIAAVSILLLSAGSFARKLIIRELEQRLGRNVDLESVTFGLPFSVNLTGLDIANYAGADSISVVPDLASLLKKKIFINRLIIRGGRYIYSGVQGQPGLTVIADNIRAEISDIAVEQASVPVKFDLSCSLKGGNREKLGNASASGWVDLKGRNMDAGLRIKDAEVAYFLPYYGDLISQRKVSSAKASFAAGIKSVNNDLTANCHFELFDIVYAEPGQATGQLPSLDLLKNTLDLFLDADGRLKLDFTVNTKFDKPQVASDKLKRLLLEAAAKNLASQPPELLIEKVANTVKQFEDFGQQMKDIFSK